MPIGLLIPDVFREALLLLFVLILELAVGCFAIGELAPVVRGSCEPAGFLAVIERLMRDDLLELVLLRLGLLDADGGSPGRVRLFELTAGCLAVVEVDGFLVLICLPIRERELVFEFVAGCLDVAEFEGDPVVIRLPIRERELVVAVFDELWPRDC
ncbi:hypothetical protein ACFL5Z_17620 [Planctomycetota bacterium]